MIHFRLFFQCSGHVGETMTDSNQWSVVIYSGDGKSEGGIARLSETNDSFRCQPFARHAASGLPAERKPVFLGPGEGGRLRVMDPVSKVISQSESSADDIFPAYAYPEAGTPRLWFVNDGDKESGCDALNCGDGGSSIMIVDTDKGEILKTLCVGRGHHVMAFSQPSAEFPAMPRRAFASNLLDGTIHVLDNDPASSRYLEIIQTLNLYQADKDKGAAGVPNNAFPHGMEYSPRSGKIYNLNNGYNTVAVIDPIGMNVERLVEMKVSSNLLLSRCGRYLIGKGADRKGNPNQVMGALPVMDTASNAIVNHIELPDIYPSTYRFNPAGDRLYVTTAATGNDKQRETLNINRLLVFDSSDLPNLPLLAEIEVGSADCGRRPFAFVTGGNGVTRVLIPNNTDGTLTILDESSLSVMATLQTGLPAGAEFAFSYWQGEIYGS